MKKIITLLCITTLPISTNFSFCQNNKSIFDSRRDELSTKLKDVVILLPSQVEFFGNFRDNNNFYYLTGISNSNSFLIITPGLDNKDILLTESRVDKELLNSFEVIEKSQLSKTLYTLSKEYQKMAAPLAAMGQLVKWNDNTSILNPFKEIINIDFLINDMRIIKSNDEIENLKEAINVTSEALNETYKLIEPGLTEKNLRSVIRYYFESNNTTEAFLQVASGPNSTNVHFGATERKLENNDMIVFDVGTFYNYYTSDISRTVPVNGTFSPEQSDIYNIVLNAQKKGIELTLKGNGHDKVQQAITDKLNEGLYELGLITDKNSEWQKALYIMHGWGHFIGLDVHDVLSYWRQMDDKTYKENMIITVEPGLYFPENYLDKIPDRVKGMVTEKEFENYRKKVLHIYKKYVNIGVRIEDDVLITKDGNIVLSKDVPKEIKDIENLMKQKSVFNAIFN